MHYVLSGDCQRTEVFYLFYLILFSVFVSGTS